MPINHNVDDKKTGSGATVRYNNLLAELFVFVHQFY